MLANRGAPMITAHVPAICRRVFDDDAVVVFDGGNAAVWGNFFTELRGPTRSSRPRTSGTSALASDRRSAPRSPTRTQVYCIIGDGAMGFNMQEIETAVRHGLRVVFLVCCDRQWGMVKINQMFALAAVWDNVRARARARPQPHDQHRPRRDRLGSAGRGDGRLRRARVAIPTDLEPALAALPGSSSAAPWCTSTSTRGASLRARPAVTSKRCTRSRRVRDSAELPADAPHGRVLVTGAGGYVGRQLVAALAREPGALRTIVASRRSAARAERAARRRVRRRRRSRRGSRRRCPPPRASTSSCTSPPS